MIQDKKRTILFLLNDTDPVFVRVIKNKFKKEAGWDAIISSKYNEAVIAFEKNKPDGVLTEIIIEDEKGRNGFDFIAEIKSKEKINKAHIVIFTELGQDDDKKKAKKLGVEYFFEKTKLSINDLIEELKKIIY